MTSGRRIIKDVNFPEESFAKGAVIFGEGDPGDAFFIVRRGSVGVFKAYGKPDQVQIATLEPGRVLGEISVIDQGPRSATAVALEPTDVTRIRANNLTYQLAQCPAWFRAIILDLVERIRQNGEIMAKRGIPPQGEAQSSYVKVPIEETPASEGE